MAQSPLAYVPLPCPSGKHHQSIVTLRSRVIALMFCLECEQGWEADASHPALRGIPLSPLADHRLP